VSHLPLPPALLQGRGKLEKRDVPGFREIIVRAFECEDCGFKWVDPLPNFACSNDQSWTELLRLLMMCFCSEVVFQAALADHFSLPHLTCHATPFCRRHCRCRADEVQLAGQYDSQGVRLRLAVPLGDAATLSRQVLKSDTATIRCACEDVWAMGVMKRSWGL